MIGHTPVRLYVMGDREPPSARPRPTRSPPCGPSCAEAIEAGAVGFATSKSTTHVGYEGRPVPSRAADLAEIVGHRRRARRRRPGRHAGHASGAACPSTSSPSIAEATGRPISWTALLAGAGGPGVSAMLLDESIKLLDQGMPVHPQVSCRPLNFEFTMAEPFPFESMRLFAPDLGGARPRRQGGDLRRTPSSAGRSREKMAGGRAGVLGGSWDRTVVSWFPPDPSLEGATSAELADGAGRRPDRPRARPGARVRPRRPLPHGGPQLRRGRGRGAAHRSAHDARPVRRRRPRQPAVRRRLLDAPAVALGARAQGPHARGRGAQAHLRAGRDLRHHRPGPAGGRAGRRRRRVRPGHRRPAPTCVGCTTSRPAPIAWSPTPSASTRSSSTASSSARTAPTSSTPTAPLPGRLLRNGSA